MNLQFCFRKAQGRIDKGAVTQVTLVVFFKAPLSRDGRAGLINADVTGMQRH